MSIKTKWNRFSLDLKYKIIGEDCQEIPIKLSDALIYASSLRRYGLQSDCSQEFFDLISNLEKHLYENI